MANSIFPDKYGLLYAVRDYFFVVCTLNRNRPFKGLPVYNTHRSRTVLRLRFTRFPGAFPVIERSPTTADRSGRVSGPIGSGRPPIDRPGEETVNPPGGRTHGPGRPVRDLPGRRFTAARHTIRTRARSRFKQRGLSLRCRVVNYCTRIITRTCGAATTPPIIYYLVYGLHSARINFLRDSARKMINIIPGRRDG